MTTNQSPAAFITGLFETHLPVANLELSMAFYEKSLVSSSLGRSKSDAWLFTG